MSRIELVALALDDQEVEESLAAVRRVMERGWFVLGPEVTAFEEELALACGTDHAVGVASGTDALTLGMQALGIGSGDEVIVPAFTAFPTAVAVLQAGATPVLVDVGTDRPHLDLEAARSAITPRTRAVVLVHLYGIPADVGPWVELASDAGIHLIEDCAQAQGATLPDGRPVGSAGVFGAFSFYPTKNLGALGDGGALVTGDPRIAEEVRAWRSHGERGTRYRHELPARNSRLDDLQAAVLRLRLAALPEVVARTRALSDRYAASLPASLSYSHHGSGGAPHLAVVRVADPTAFSAHLAERSIATGRHYPLALDAQPALAAVPRCPAPRAAAWAASCVSLPLHRHLEPDDIDRVVAAIEDAPGR